MKTDLAYFLNAGISLPQAGNQEADHYETEDEQSRHDQAQERHITCTIPDVRGGWDGHSCRERWE